MRLSKVRTNVTLARESDCVIACNAIVAVWKIQ